MDNLTVSELSISITALESEIRAAIKRFQEKTKLLPSEIHVEFLERNQVGYPPDRVLGQIKAKVEI